MNLLQNVIPSEARDLRLFAMLERWGSLLALLVEMTFCGILVFPAVAQTFERSTAPFPVYDSLGNPFDIPFTGGFNNPRPQLVDIDADGDLDLFIQEQVDRVIFLENEGARFVWRTGDFEELEVGQWMRLLDADGDGDFDALAEQPIGYVRYYRNDGTPEEAEYTLVEDTLHRTDGLPIFISAQNTPVAVDLTCDARPDLVEGQTSGLMAFYTHEGINAEGVPQYQLVSDEYQDLCFGPPSVCGFRKNVIPQDQLHHGPSPSQPLRSASQSKHGASALGAGDVDGDGDTDLLWGDFFQTSMYFVENRGGCPLPNLARALDFFPPQNPMRTAGYNAPYPADLDLDGDADLLAGVLAAVGRWSVDNLFYFENSGGAYNLRTRRFIYTPDVGRQSYPAFTDIDGDADLDLLVGNALAPVGPRRSQVALFLNQGTPNAPSFRLQTHDLLPELPDGAYNAAPAPADLDNDGDPDLLIGFFDGSLLYFEQVGSLGAVSFEQRSIAALGLDEALDVGTNASPALVDIDGDEDLDLFVGNDGVIAFYRNEGSSREAEFRLVTERFAGIEADDARPAFHFAGDTLRLFLGVGTGVTVYDRTDATSFIERTNVEVPTSGTAPAAADLNGDGRVELLVGGERGGLFYYEGMEGGAPNGGGSNSLLPNRPNPFSEATDIYFRLEEPANVRLAVYDVWGRRVAVPVAEERSAGLQAVAFTPRRLASGVYAVILTVNGRLAGSRTILYLP